MANLATIEKQALEKLFQMGSGYVLNFSDRTMCEFFRNDVGLDIFAKKYNYGSGSKANRIRGLWLKADDKTVAETILKLIEYIESQSGVNSFCSSSIHRRFERGCGKGRKSPLENRLAGKSTYISPHNSMS